MKKLVFIGTLLLLNNLNAFELPWGFELPWEDNKQKASVKKVIEGTIEIKENIKEISLEHIVENIQYANRLVAEIKTDVNSEGFFSGKKDDNQKFEIILEGTEELRDFYIELHSNNPEIKVKILEYKSNILDYAIALKKKLLKEKSDLKSLEYKLESLSNEHTGAKLDTITKSLKQRIKFSHKRVDMMNLFIQNYSKLGEILSKVEENIDKFIYSIENTKLVYQSAYKTLKLGKDIKTAYQDLENLKSLEQLSDDMISSWKNLDIIVERLTQEIAVLED